MKDTFFEQTGQKYVGVAKTLTIVEEHPTMFEPQQEELLTKVLDEYEQMVKMTDSDS